MPDYAILSVCVWYAPEVGASTSSWEGLCDLAENSSVRRYWAVGRAGQLGRIEEHLAEAIGWTIV